MMTEDVYEAICQDVADELRKLIYTKKRGNFNPRDWEMYQIWPGRSRRMSALQLAVREGSLKCVELLISLGIDVNYGGAANALTTALEFEQSDVFKVLLDLGAFVNKKISHGYNRTGQVIQTCPIDMSLGCSSTEYLRTLLYHGADPLIEYTNLQDPNHGTITPLVPAAGKENRDFLRLLLQYIPSIDAGTSMSKTIQNDLAYVFTSTFEKHKDEDILMMLLNLGFNGCFIISDDQSFQDSINKIVMDYIKTPQTLKQLCRLVIRKNYEVYNYVQDCYLSATVSHMSDLDSSLTNNRDIVDGYANQVDCYQKDLVESGPEMVTGDVSDIHGENKEPNSEMVDIKSVSDDSVNCIIPGECALDVVENNAQDHTEPETVERTEQNENPELEDFRKIVEGLELESASVTENATVEDINTMRNFVHNSPLEVEIKEGSTEAINRLDIDSGDHPTHKDYTQCGVPKEEGGQTLDFTEEMNMSIDAMGDEQVTAGDCLEQRSLPRNEHKLSEDAPSSSTDCNNDHCISSEVKQDSKAKVDVPGKANPKSLHQVLDQLPLPPLLIGYLALKYL